MQVKGLTMIEKLKQTVSGFDDKPEMPTAIEFFNKINELCDVVDELQEFCDVADKHLATLIEENNIHEKQIDELQMKVEPEKREAPFDQYSEQHRWIGKLCRFRDNPACEWRYGILYKIYEDSDYPFWDADCNEYGECEPVKPDDDLIYKGEDNE